METKFIPFIPEYIPSVGDTDPFIKVKSYYNQRNNFYVIMSNLTQGWATYCVNKQQVLKKLTETPAINIQIVSEQNKPFL